MGYLENKQSVIRDKTAKAFVIGPDVDPVEVGSRQSGPEEFTQEGSLEG